MSFHEGDGTYRQYRGGFCNEGHSSDLVVGGRIERDSDTHAMKMMHISRPLHPCGDRKFPSTECSHVSPLCFAILSLMQKQLIVVIGHGFWKMGGQIIQAAFRRMDEILYGAQ